MSPGTMRNLRSRNGFSLAELLLVLAVAALLAALGARFFLVMAGRQAAAREAARQRDSLAAMVSAMQRVVDHRVAHSFVASPWWEATGRAEPEGWELRELRVRYYSKAGQAREWILQRRNGPQWEWGDDQGERRPGPRGRILLSHARDGEPLPEAWSLRGPSCKRLIEGIWVPSRRGPMRMFAIFVE